MVVLFLELMLVCWTHCFSDKWCTKCQNICRISCVLRWLFPKTLPVRILFLPFLHFTPLTRRVHTQNQWFPSFFIRIEPPHNEHVFDSATMPILVNRFDQLYHPNKWMDIFGNVLCMCRRNVRTLACICCVITDLECADSTKHGTYLNIHNFQKYVTATEFA